MIDPVTTDAATPLRLVPRPTNARTTAPSDSTRRRWARMATVEAAAREAAHADGVREGYRSGWRLGMVAGMLIGALIVGIAWAAR